MNRSIAQHLHLVANLLKGNFKGRKEKQKEKKVDGIVLGTAALLGRARDQCRDGGGGGREEQATHPMERLQPVHRYALIW
jgi:hypothetical protein